MSSTMTHGRTTINGVIKLSNGWKISIQRSTSHHCGDTTYELLAWDQADADGPTCIEHSWMTWEDIGTLVDSIAAKKARAL